MHKVTLKLKNKGMWVDGPVVLLSSPELTEFCKTHTYFKVEDATDEDLKRYGSKMPSAFEGMFAA